MLTQQDLQTYEQVHNILDWLAAEIQERISIYIDPHDIGTYLIEKIEIIERIEDNKSFFESQDYDELIKHLIEAYNNKTLIC